MNKYIKVYLNKNSEDYIYKLHTLKKRIKGLKYTLMELSFWNIKESFENLIGAWVYYIVYTLKSYVNLITSYHIKLEKRSNSKFSSPSFLKNNK